MKALLYTALALAIPGTMADISLGETAAPTAAAESTPEESRQYEDMANEVLNVVRELTTLLQGVKDQASADAAATQIGGVTTRMIELQKKAESMPRPDAATELRVRNSMDIRQVQQVVRDFLDSFIRIGMNNAYGSQALMDALEPVVNAMPGNHE